MRLSDREKKKIIAAYSECGNYSAVARKYHVSRSTVKNVIEKHPEAHRLFTEQQEKNTADILAYMNEKSALVCDFIDLYLNELSDKRRIECASLKDIGLTLGIVIDKFTRANGANEDKNGQLEKLLTGLKKDG